MNDEFLFYAGIIFVILVVAHHLLPRWFPYRQGPRKKLGATGNAPDWVEAMNRPRPDAKPPLWDRWLDG